MAGVKVFVALPRKADVTKQHFHDHWRHPHATWGLAMAARTHYVQSHQIDTAHLGEEQRRYDGIAEIWFDDVVDAANFNKDPVYQERLAPDEPSFVEMKNVRFLVADEEVLMSGPTPQNRSNPNDVGWREQDRPVTVKLIQFFEPSAKSWAGDDDKALGLAIGAFRHVRCRPNQTMHQKWAFVSGVRELWWPTLSAFERGVAGAPDAWATLTTRAQALTLLASAERHL